MALSPEQIEQADFGSSLRGFDKQEVRSYLARIARSMRQAEAELAAKSEVVASPIPPKPAASEMTDEDRFGALGERVANLLRNAHDSAAQIKANADGEVAEMVVSAEMEVADALREVERAKAEAAEIRAQAEQDAIEIRKQAEIAGTAKLDTRREEIEANELVIQQDQEQALAELSRAREQVGDLLEQARAQSEFIRLEADDIIREKIRANLDAAEGRLNVLRNTEEISRERIRLAQTELESALGRLEAEPAPALPHGSEDLVLEEAEHRAIEAGYVVGVQDSAANAPVSSEAQNDVQVDDDIIDAELVEADIIEADVVDVDTIEVDSTESSVSNDVHVVDEVDTLVAEGAPYDSAPEEGTVAAVEDEDALTRLVREAMQSAVETARSGE